jgi:RNA polymerase sigma factor (sigma-70 family)
VNPRFHPQAAVARPLRRSPSDARLVELARGGSEPAFEAIVARYRLPLVRHCARLIGEADAEDAAQDALLNAHAALLRGAAVRQLAPWLYAIAQNAARSSLRARGARPATADAACDRGVLAHGSAEGRQELREVLAAVSSLPDRQRDAIVMRELEGRSYDEIASRLGASQGAVRQLLNRARGSVRDRIRALVPIEPFVRWALSRSSGANAAGGNPVGCLRPGRQSVRRCAVTGHRCPRAIAAEATPRDGHGQRKAGHNQDPQAHTSGGAVRDLAARHQYIPGGAPDLIPRLDARTPVCGGRAYRRPSQYASPATTFAARLAR